MKRLGLLTLLPILWGCSNLAPFSTMKSPLLEATELELVERVDEAATESEFQTPPPPDAIRGSATSSSPQTANRINASLPYIPVDSTLSAEAISPRGFHRVPTEDRRGELSATEDGENDFGEVELPAIRPGNVND